MRVQIVIDVTDVQDPHAEPDYDWVIEAVYQLRVPHCNTMIVEMEQIDE